MYIHTKTHIHECIYSHIHMHMGNLHMYISKHKSKEDQNIISTCVPTCLALPFWSLHVLVEVYAYRTGIATNTAAVQFLGSQGTGTSVSRSAPGV